MRKFGILLAAIFTLSACATTTPYPHAPQFASPQTVPARSIPVPPAPYSAEWTRDLEEVIAVQKAITPEKIITLRAEMPVVPEMIVQPVLGKNFTREAFPKLYDLLIKTGSDAWRIGDEAKEYWNTSRPWLMDKRVKLYVDPIYSKAYPSGHTTTGHVWAGVLSQLMPCQRQALFGRALEIAEHRKIAGVHYRHDIKGGQALAENIVREFKHDPTYQQSLEAARAELRAHLRGHCSEC